MTYNSDIKINFKMTLPAHLMQPITQPEVKPALMTQPILQNAQVQVASSDLISRIWNAILECFKSCFSWVTLKKNSDYEFRLTTDESQIQARLQRQMQHGLQQMQVEPAKSFRYQIAPSTWDMHEETVGGYRVGISHAQGRRLTMEDEHLAVSFNLLIAGRSYPVQLFGIFDGHGGPKASQFIRDNLKNKLNESLLEFNPQGLTDAGIWKALKMTTVRLNREFIQKYPAVADTQGSTATFAMILDNKIWTANVGDARTVLNNNGIPVQLSEDAKPSDNRYKKGIEKRGGFVVNGHPPRVNGVLAVARAIGDHGLKGAISARPKITVKPLSEVQVGSHLILCCDGVYDVARTVDVVNAVQANRYSHPGFLARNIVYSAYQSGSGDNLSSMVIKVK